MASLEIEIRPSAAPSLAVGAPLEALPADAPQTLAGVLLRAGEGGGELVRLRADGPPVRRDYAALLARARRILGGLRARGAAPGDRVVFQVQPAEDFVAALWACLLGGFPVVPASPASADPGGQAAERLRQVRDLLGRPLVLAGAASADAARAALGAGAEIVVVEEAEAHEADLDPHPSEPGDDAVLLLSSGSTGRPKLVRRTHRNLLAGCRSALAGGGYGARAVTFLTWLPLDHNAALTGSLQLAAMGARQLHLPTRDALDDPLRWLDALHAHRVTHAGATAYFLGLLRRAVDAAPGRRWDLSALERVTVTAEPLPAETARAFLRALAPHGLRDGALRVSYGMSEAGGIATRPGLDVAALESADGFVEVGAPFPGVSIRIVDAAGAVVGEGAEGRIQVRSETVTPGYVGDPDASAAALGADGWLDTGDTGRIAGGSLAITGRDKDVLIVNGLNLHAEELEAAVERLSGVERGHVAACAARRAGRETEEAAVFLHTRLTDAGERDALRREVRSALGARFGAPVARVLLVEPADIPRTALGKVRRSTLRDLLAAGAFAAAAEEDDASAAVRAYHPPRDERERVLCALWEEVLGTAPVGIHDSFFALGGHSLAAARVLSRVRAALGIDAPPRTLFEHPTVAAFAAAVAPLGGAAAGPDLLGGAEAEALLAGIDDLSEADLDLLLARLSTTGESV